MKFKNLITAIDSHTEGQFTRMVVSGYPKILGKTVAEKRDFARQNLDHLRTAILHEPRGTMSAFGCVMTPPVSEKADFGVIWMESGAGPEKRYIDGCLHGTMGVAITAVETGIVEPKEPVTEIGIDVPSGFVRARVNVENGKSKSVTVQNIPCFLYKTEAVKVSGLGEIQVDIAFGGNNYAIVEAKDLGIGTTSVEIRGARELAGRVLAAINEQVKIQHPEKPYIKEVLALLINDKPTRQGATVKNVYADEVGGMDRSPCGTGTSARMAARHAKGELGLGETFVTESVIGSIFYGKLIKEVDVGGIKAVIPEVTGRAYITGISQFIIDEDDPFKYGFQL
ncbi:proline racemase family protein [Chloroflexota bacterium]